MILERDNIYNTIIGPFLSEYKMPKEAFEELLGWPGFVEMLYEGLDVTIQIFTFVLEAIALFEQEMDYEQCSGG